MHEPRSFELDLAGRGLSRVHLVPHDPSWAAAYEKEAAVLRERLGGVVACTHHIGSTAVPGIHAKPIIDILVEVTDLDAVDARGDSMAAAGYEAMGEYGIAGRRYFRRHNAQGERTHHVHVYAAGSDQVRRHVAFRDLLRTDPALAGQYSDLKRRLAREHRGDSRTYSDRKAAFIARVSATAAGVVSPHRCSSAGPAARPA